MKTRTQPRFCKFELRILSYANSYYIERIKKLERLLARKPRTVKIDMIGIGEIPADLALLMRSVLLARSPKTRVITNARSSLQNGSVLVWLLGEQRLIREDARVFFRPAEIAEEDEATIYAGLNDNEPKYKDSFSGIDPEEGDCARVLQAINEFLPVREFAGKLIGTAVLKQFGLIENERLDLFLATAFGKTERETVFR
jgi:hypothetical protein